MANPFTQYIRDTRNELKHVAWPTQLQTIVYTALVIAISIGIAAYLGLFDFLFTTVLGRVIDVLPQGGAQNAITVTPATTTAATTSDSTGAIPFDQAPAQGSTPATSQ